MCDQVISSKTWLFCGCFSKEDEGCQSTWFGPVGVGHQMELFQDCFWHWQHCAKWCWRDEQLSFCVRGVILWHVLFCEVAQVGLLLRWWFWCDNFAVISLWWSFRAGDFVALHPVGTHVFPIGSYKLETSAPTSRGHYFYRDVCL